MQIKFMLERATKGALRYQEVDDAGTPLTNADGAKVGTLYFRKTAFPGAEPKGLIVNVDVQE